MTLIQLENKRKLEVITFLQYNFYVSVSLTDDLKKRVNALNTLKKIAGDNENVIGVATIAQMVGDLHLIHDNKSLSEDLYNEGIDKASHLIKFYISYYESLLG